MAEGPTIDVPVPMPADGNGGRTKQRAYVAMLLGLCIVIRAAIAVLCFFKAPAQWDVITSLNSDMNIVIASLMGGLLGITRPSGT